MKIDDFLHMGYSPEQALMLADMHRAVRHAKLWEYIAHRQIDYRDKELLRLQKHIRYDGYTSESYAWTLSEIKKFAPSPTTSFTALWKDFVGELQGSNDPRLRDFAEKVKVKE